MSRTQVVATLVFTVKNPNTQRSRSGYVRKGLGYLVSLLPIPEAVVTTKPYQHIVEQTE